MRRATAADEILPLKDPRVQKNEAYLIVILLSRVVTRLGSVAAINPKVIESLFATDLAFLQDLYNRINQLETPRGSVPALRQAGRRSRDGSHDHGGALGGVVGYPLAQLTEEVAFIAYHFHWPHDDIMNLEHRDRRRWVETISSLNQRANAG